MLCKQDTTLRRGRGGEGKEGPRGMRFQERGRRWGNNTIPEAWVRRGILISEENDTQAEMCTACPPYLPGMATTHPVAQNGLK